MNQLLELALRYIGAPYKWGGRNPVSGFDCSGLVSELLKSCGVLPHHSDLNAQGLYDLLLGSGANSEIGVGAIAFYGNGPDKIDHVAFCLDSCRIMEAGGGDHTTLTVADAAARNACVRIRPVHFREDLVSVRMPVYPWGAPK